MIQFLAPDRIYTTPDGDYYRTTGHADYRGEPLLEALLCPVHLRGQFEVPLDGIELRHGRLTEVVEEDES